MKKTSKIAVFSLLLLTAASSPAFAHNQLVSTSPDAGSTVQAGIIPITLHFEEAPLDLGVNQSNLIAVADAQTGEQLGAACALIAGTDLTTTIDIAKAGEYKILWRSASDDGHVASGDFIINVENTTNYQTDTPGNLCFDEFGVPLEQTDTEVLSTKQEAKISALDGLYVGIGFIVAGSVLSALLIRRKQKREEHKNFD
jgi:methionine-rich copper-binding protein CopC